MQNPHLIFSGILAGCLLLLPGCGNKQPDPETALQNAVKQMEKPAPESAPQAPAPASPTPTAPKQPPTVTPPPIAAQMSQALSAYKSGDYVDAVTRLQQLRAMQGKTPEQTLALQEAMASVVNEIGARAAKGDTRAQAAVKEYERIQNAKR